MRNTAMTPLDFTLVNLGLSFCAGILGALLGIGGGIIIVPALTLLLGIDIRYAIGASIVSVIATSICSSSTYLKKGIANMRLGMFLEAATAAGAITGAFIAGIIDAKWLYFIFAFVLLYLACTMARLKKKSHLMAEHSDDLARRLRLDGRYYNEALDQEIHYGVRHTWGGFGMSGVAGMASGLLGVGGGFLKVPTMDAIMGVPIKVATTTSNFMIGVTAAASAGVYFARGDIDPFITAPVATGVILGSLAGTAILKHISSARLRYAFVALLIWIAIGMFLK
ncbi:MAG: sulfite exporter TauE/SafE family protein, partial [bacterium]